MRLDPPKGLSGNRCRVYVQFGGNLECGVVAVSGRTAEQGDAPSHGVKTECITAEVTFHDKACTKLTLESLQSAMKVSTKVALWQRQRRRCIEAPRRQHSPTQPRLDSRIPRWKSRVLHQDCLRCGIWHEFFPNHSCSWWGGKKPPKHLQTVVPLTVVWSQSEWVL